MLIGFLMLLPQGRSVAKGVSIATISHAQALMGKRYESWNPVR